MQEGRVIPERLSITVRPPDIPSERRYPPSFRTARTLRMSAIRLIDGDLASNAKEPHPSPSRAFRQRRTACACREKSGSERESDRLATVMQLSSPAEPRGTR